MRAAPLRLALGLVVAAAACDGLWLSLLWPDWRPIAAGPVPSSRFMRDWEREAGRKARWEPVALSDLSAATLKAVVVAEDSGFWEHGAFDVKAIEEAARKDAKRRKIVLGGSTIDQQTAKNLFLTADKSPLRKWHEAVLTWGLERHASKRRILEVYLNDAELGPGIYGLEAAAEEYFGHPAAQLTQAEAIEIAATLPSPRLDNPRTRTVAFEHRVEKVTGLLAEIGELEVELPEELPEEVPVAVDSAGGIAPLAVDSAGRIAPESTP